MPITGDLYNFTEDNVNGAPQSAGVYALYDAYKQLVYIGRAKGGTTTIRSRLQDHKAGREGLCTQSASYYRREVCSNPVAREAELLMEYKRLNGRLPRCNDVMP